MLFRSEAYLHAYLRESCGKSNSGFTRSMSAYGFPNYLRITVGTEAENRRFLTALAECLHELHYV